MGDFDNEKSAIGVRGAIICMGHDGDVGLGLGVAAGGEGGLDPYFVETSEQSPRAAVQRVHAQSNPRPPGGRTHPALGCECQCLVPRPRSKALHAGKGRQQVSPPRISELSLQNRQPGVSRLVRKTRQLIEVQIPIKAGRHAVDAARVLLIFFIGWQAP